MLHYFINTKHDSHEMSVVHNEKCKVLPAVSTLNYVGMFRTPEEAIFEAKKDYQHINGCKFCMPEYNHKNCV